MEEEEEEEHCIIRDCDVGYIASNPGSYKCTRRIQSLTVPPFSSLLRHSFILLGTRALDVQDASKTQIECSREFTTNVFHRSLSILIA